MPVWDDMKKLGKLLLDQTKGQKDIFLLNLKIKSFAEKQDLAFGNLGRRLYPQLKEGRMPDPEDEELKNQLKEMEELEQEVHAAGEELEELKKSSADERDQIFTEMEHAWETAREAFRGVMKEKESTEENVYSASGSVTSGAVTSGSVSEPGPEKEDGESRDKPAE